MLDLLDFLAKDDSNFIGFLVTLIIIFVGIIQIIRAIKGKF